MSEYRNQVKQASKDSVFTAWTLLKWGLLLVVVGALLYWAGLSLGIISMDIKRETVQHSQQYVETKVSMLHKLHNDWLDLNSEIIELQSGEENEELISAKRAQQKNIVKRLREESDLIQSSQVPESVKEFLLTH